MVKFSFDWREIISIELRGSRRGGGRKRGDRRMKEWVDVKKERERKGREEERRVEEWK